MICNRDEEAETDNYTSGAAEPADEPLDNNRPENHELPGGRKDRDDTPRSSPASQVGRSKTGGGAESVLDPEEIVREGWPVPDHSDTPSEWPEPTVD